MLAWEGRLSDKNVEYSKEQARKYARTENARFVIFSNGNLHYFWDLERGDPEKDYVSINTYLK
ncbi:MAG: hypothetical protein V1770_03330 [bacterium]